MIVDPSGRLLRTQTLPLDATAVRCLCDGRYLLRHLDTVLATVHLEPVCRHCVASGLDGHVSVQCGEHRAEFRCDHTAGWVRLDRGPLEVEQLLTTLGWTVRCTDCRQAATGDNSKGAASFTVQCPCTSREMPNPLAAHKLAGVADGKPA